MSLCCLLVFVQHLVEGVVKLARDRVDLQLLPDDLVLQLVDPEREGNFVNDAGGQGGHDDEGDIGDGRDVLTRK